MGDVFLPIARRILPLYADGKDIEVRTKYGDAARVKEGDIINSFNQFRRRVVRVREYRDFEEMIRVENPDRIYPGKNKFQILSLLRLWYKPEYEAQGVLVFELERVGSNTRGNK